MRKIVYVLIVLLIILHHDFWFWDDDTLLFGFLPVGLAWHMGISTASAIVWALTVVYAWPEHVDLPDDEASTASIMKKEGAH